MAKILIYETCQERTNGLYRQVQWFYNTATDAVESQINAGVNSCSAYSYNPNNPVHFFCVNGTTTRKTVFHAGGGTVRYEETLNSPDCGYDPPGDNPLPEDCDLVISSAEASPARKGVKNGLVVINITGGTLPMEYSVDGVNFESSNYIGELAPGNYIAYARKGNQIACIANKAFTVAELPGITIEVSSGCEGGLGFIDLTVTSPETESFTIELLNQTTQELIQETIESVSSYNYLYTNLTNGDWVVKVKGSLNTFENISAVQKLQCAPGTGNGQGGKRISEMEELDALNDQVYFPVIDLTEIDTSKQNKKIHRSKLPLGTVGGTTIVGGGLQKKAVSYVPGTNTYVFPFPITGKNFDSADVLGETGQIWEMDFDDPADNATEITFTNPKPIGAGLLRLWYNPAVTTTGGGENPGGEGTISSILDYLEEGENIEFSGAGTKSNKLVITAIVPEGETPPGSTVGKLHNLDFTYAGSSTFDCGVPVGRVHYVRVVGPTSAADLFDEHTTKSGNNVTLNVDSFETGDRIFISFREGTGTTTPPTNTAPTANAGSDQTITLPTNQVTLTGSGTDAGGSIASYAWSKISALAATITTPNAATTTVTGLVQGTHTFRLTVTDNGGLTAQDEVMVIVNAAVTPPTDNGIYSAEYNEVYA